MSNYKETDFIEITKNKIIYFKNGQKITKDYKLQAKKIRKYIRNSNFEQFYKKIGGKNARNEKLEYAKLPSFAHLYYSLFCETNIVPNAEFFVNEYIKKFCEKQKNNMYSLKD